MRLRFAGWKYRTRLNNMKPDELTNYFARYGDNLPTEIAQAVTELPPEYSGVPQSRHDLLTERALNAQYGDAIAEIKEIEQAIEAAESSVEAARDEVRLEVGIHDPAKFNELAAPIEAQYAAPWLRRRKNSSGAEEIRVVDLDRKVERPATPEEIENGIEYRDYDHLHGRKSSMTHEQQGHPDDARRSCEDQVATTRRVLREMNDKADRAIDDPGARFDADDAEK